MSSTVYSGRRAPNGPEYLRGLNTIPPQDVGADDDTYGLDDDLTMFTNTRFFDFDVGQNTDFQVRPVKSGGDLDAVSATETSSIAIDQPVDSVSPDIAGLDYIRAQHLPFPAFSGHYTAHDMPNFPDNAQSVHDLHASLTSIYAPSLPQHRPHMSVSSPPTEEQNAEAVDHPSNSSVEEVSRVAAEEDKRRRNTAASARFRIKKKQREQALEKSAKEMADKVTKLESKIQQLETENKWLKNLIMEKNNDGKEDPPALDKDSGPGHGQERAERADRALAQNEKRSKPA